MLCRVALQFGLNHVLFEQRHRDLKRLNFKRARVSMSIVNDEVVSDSEGEEMLSVEGSQGARLGNLQGAFKS